jgi:hypothetical protein
MNRPVTALPTADLVAHTYQYADIIRRLYVAGATSVDASMRVLLAGIPGIDHSKAPCKATSIVEITSEGFGFAVSCAL